MDELTLRTGFEIELLAPAGSDRQVLADELAARLGGRVRRSFHTDSEPSVVPGVGVFRHLSPAFDVVDADGRPVARLVDDITIEADLPRGAPRRRGWYRVLCDDARLLRLIERHADPAAPLDTVLDPVAALFGVRTDLVGSAARVDDASGATVAVATPLPAGRERPCEIITPPIGTDHAAALERLLVPARELGFTVPQEAAVHLHVDGAPFRRPEAFANVVRLFGHWRSQLWAALGTNPACRRLAPLPEALLDLVESTGDARELATGLTKYADVNLAQLVTDTPARDTLEVRILPGAIDGPGIVERAALVESLLGRCLDPTPLPRPTDHATLDDLLGVRR
ncbi:amidoligase family protein [Cellulomonas xylanilytica]|uniref:Amidoligase enzyme n=1 Tax=Cellulomonas xylanilytica TaxID=233583 RepID=A0A510V539_9CELL|nr:amidoligase family protein [Cellulomonas xylanilytica]GEK21987.1 hypothetical protein CXY01_25070 [Cellulomonas xylanilytica]